MFNSIFNIADEFIKDPVGKSIEIATQPVADAIDIVDGLTVGELRAKAAIRLGADTASGMALSELLEALTND